jgi:protoporphyrinogen/coproporphyrinogen III oxidase
MTMEKKHVDVTIIGAGLTGLTAAFYLVKAGKKVAVIEKQDRIGGVIRTIHKEGFVFETGPNTGVFSSPELVRLFDDLGERCKPEFANQKGKQRWIWKNGRWHALPSGLLSAIRTPLFSWNDKFRILAEPLRRRGTDPHETVAGLVRRRMGRSYLDYAVDPFISGIYAGDPERLVTKYALPKLYRLEQDYGSFIRGAIKKAKEPKDALTRRATKAVFSVEGGLQRLTDALGEAVGREQFYLSTQNLTVQPGEAGFTTAFLQHGKQVEISSDSVISTTGSHVLRQTMGFLTREELQPVEALEYAKVVQVVAAYSKWPGRALNAFGGLIPSRERRDALGILFTSAIFPGRAPGGGAILSVFMGGRRRPDIHDMVDEQIRELALQEIRETLDTGETAPDHLEIYRYRHAIPQYEADSGERFEAVRRIETAYPGLVLAGNMRDGIGISDRVKQGYTVAQEVLQ